MVKKGGIPDQARAAVWFMNWWREEGGLISASTPALRRDLPDAVGPAAHVATQRRGWGFDLEWTVSEAEMERYDARAIQGKMEECVDAFVRAAKEEEQEGGRVSSTQEKKRVREELLAKRAKRTKSRLAARRSG